MIEHHSEPDGDFGREQIRENAPQTLVLGAHGDELFHRLVVPGRRSGRSTRRSFGELDLRGPVTPRVRAVCSKVAGRVGVLGILRMPRTRLSMKRVSSGRDDF